MSKAAGIAIGAILMLGSTSVFAQQAQPATVQLRGPNGQDLGSATLTQQGGGIRVAVQARNMPPGMHGIHFHAVGRCDPPDFESAGPHFNPTNRQHGLRNPQGPHAADLPNLEVAANGTGQLNVVNNLLTLDSGSNSLFDADGSALVVHANADDEVTDPTGNSGGRIACGAVARASAAAQPSPAAKPAGAPVQAPGALPRTGDAVTLVGTLAPWGAAGAAMLLGGLALRRRRQ